MNYVFHILCLIALTACAPVNNVSAPSPELDSLDIKLDNFNLSETELSSWLFVFSSHGPGLYGDTVKTFSSGDAVYRETIKIMSADMPKIKGRDYVAATMQNRFEDQVDFNTQNLVMVYLTTGGPPFGTFTNSLVDQTYVFCVEEPDNPSGVSGMALNFELRIYILPKPYKAKICEKR